MTGRLRVPEVQAVPQRGRFRFGEGEQLGHRPALDVGGAQEVADGELVPGEEPLELEVRDPHGAMIAGPGCVPCGSLASDLGHVAASVRVADSPSPCVSRSQLGFSPLSTTTANPPPSSAHERPRERAERRVAAIRARRDAAVGVGAERALRERHRGIAGALVPDEEPAPVREPVRPRRDEPVAREDRAHDGPVDGTGGGGEERAVRVRARCTRRRRPTRRRPASGPRSRSASGSPWTWAVRSRPPVSAPTGRRTSPPTRPPTRPAPRSRPPGPRRSRTACRPRSSHGWRSRSARARRGTAERRVGETRAQGTGDRPRAPAIPTRRPTGQPGAVSPPGPPVTRRGARAPARPRTRRGSARR